MIPSSENRWFHPQNLMDVEKYLDQGMLYAPINYGKFWLMRRNGQTKKWVKSPNRFRIPFKYGFKGTGALDETTDLKLFRVAGSREDAEV